MIYIKKREKKGLKKVEGGVKLLKLAKTLTKKFCCDFLPEKLYIHYEFCCVCVTYACLLGGITNNLKLGLE